jgi:hypothetical protein
MLRYHSLLLFHAAGRYRRFCMIQNPPGTLNSRPCTYKSDLDQKFTKDGLAALILKCQQSLT